MQEPAYKALVTDLLTKTQYSQASGLMQLASSAQYLISPFLAGILLAMIEMRYIFLIDMTTFVIASLLVLLVRKSLKTSAKATSQKSIASDLKEGLKAFRRNPGVVNLVLVIMLILFFVGLLQALLVPMLMNLADVKNVGISQSVSSVGMILGSLILGLLNTKHSQIKMLSIALFFAGLFFALMGVPQNYMLVTVAGFLFFLALPFINTPCEVLIRKNVDNDKQGRIWSIVSTITYFGSILAFLTAGFLADKVFGPLLMSNGCLVNSIGIVIGTGKGRGIALLFIISGIMISISSIYILVNRNINKLERNYSDELS